MNKYWILALFIFVFLPVVSANTQGVNVSITEDGRLTSYLNTYWVVNVEGSGTITNPSDQDLFDVRLFYDLMDLTIIEREGDGTFADSSVYFRRIPAQTTLTFNYQIVGITAQPPTLSNKGVLYTGLAKRTPRIYSDVFGELQKAPLEDPDYTGRNARLISVTFENPSTLEYTVESLRVIKTPDLNPNQILDEWKIVTDDSPKRIPADGFFVEDFIDTNAYEGEVYWLQSDIFLSKVNLLDTNNISRFTEQNLSVAIEELDFLNETDNTTAYLPSSEYMLRKRVSNTLATPGEPVTITLQLYNFQSSLRRYVIEDELPTGFSTESDLVWEGEVPARNSITLSYDAVLTDASTSGIDSYPRAKATIRSNTVRSQPVPFIRQYVSSQNLYVQKRVSFVDEETSSVSISVRNLGEGPLSNIIIQEFLSERDEFSQLTRQPESRGVWNVDSLAPGDEWTVSYVTTRGDITQTLPAVYGIDSNSVLRTLVLENVVNEAWSFVRTRAVELFGILVLLTAPILLYFNRKYDWIGF